MQSKLFSACPLIVVLLFNFAARGAERDSADAFSRDVFQCQHPMELVDFAALLRMGQGHKAIRWDFRALSLHRPTGARIVQESQDAVSPGGTLALNENCAVQMTPMTLERKWLDALRGTEAVELLPRERQIVLWLNEDYHLFSVQKEDVCKPVDANPVFSAVKNGAYVFTAKNIAFIISKDQRHFVVCPKQGLDQAQTEMNKRDLTNGIKQFMQDPKIRRFFECETLLASRNI